MFKIKFQKKDREPVFLQGKYNTKDSAFNSAKILAEKTMFKYEIDNENYIINFENGDIMCVERISILKKEFR